MGMDKGRGVRFAPSPTGDFHIGNLRTAWISWAWAQALGEAWIVRFEDIDTPRVIPGAQERQLEDLRALGMRPDGVILQSSRRGRHWDLFARAAAAGQVYPCFCSRKDVQSALSAPHDAAPAAYTGKCRDRTAAPDPLPATIGWRFRSILGDPIVARTVPDRLRPLVPDPVSFMPSYHWACAIDDWDGQYRLLVRASDLAQATPLQRDLQTWIAREEKAPAAFAAVFHTALVVSDDGHRLEKRTRGVTLNELRQAGFSEPELIRCFDRSLDERIAPGFGPGLVWGESKNPLPLSQLQRLGRP
jgi:glutamyl-tRNA synthetase